MNRTKQTWWGLFGPLPAWSKQTSNRIRPRGSLGYGPPAPTAIVPAELIPMLVGFTCLVVQALVQVREDPCFVVRTSVPIN